MLPQCYRNRIFFFHWVTFTLTMASVSLCIFPSFSFFSFTVSFAWPILFCMVNKNRTLPSLNLAIFTLDTYTCFQFRKEWSFTEPHTLLSSLSALGQGWDYCRQESTSYHKSCKFHRQQSASSDIQGLNWFSLIHKKKKTPKVANIIHYDKIRSCK